MLKIYDSLNRQKREFKPLNKNNVNMYVCGVTVYDYCHIGHARTYVAFDMVYRYLSYKGYKVNYIRNITDIDDKIINRANERNIESSDLANQFINIMHEDFATLDLIPPKSEPRATDTIDDIIEFIEDLILSDNAYVGANGDVFFAVKDFKDYGHLAHQTLDSLLSGARVDKNLAKKDQLDFVLWKMAKKGEPSWKSPWGDGRPGWHIECSAMANKMLGETLDIHGGGFDLKFPHHENERAQSEARSGKKFVNYWMHAGFLQIDNEKMSKSLKNFLTIRDVLANYPAEIIRCFLGMSHYRSEIHYSDVSVKQTKNALDRLYTSIRDVKLIKVDLVKPTQIINQYIEKFNTVMDDDFNAPDAFAVLFELAREVNKIKDYDIQQAGELAYLLKSLASIFGILQQDPETYFQHSGATKYDSDDVLSDAEIDGLIKQREQARLDKDYKKSDLIREQLLNNGVVLDDTAKGTSWRRK